MIARASRDQQSLLFLQQSTTVCGRYTHRYRWKQLQALMRLTSPELLLPIRFNVAPTQAAPVVRVASEPDSRELVMLRWGLLPPWAEDASFSGKYQTFNARSETASITSTFREAFARRRCLVPIDGFFEWPKVGQKAGQPHLIQRCDDAPFALAGLWETWTAKADLFGPGQPVESFTILTTQPNGTVRPLHDRMPVVLAPDDYDRWLDPQAMAPALTELLRPCPDDWLEAFPVSKLVNSAKNDEPECVQPLASQ